LFKRYIMNQNYICNIPVVLIIFNRPNETKILIESLRVVKPTKVIVIADGPRLSNENDYINTAKTRMLIDEIDWECELIKIFRKDNLGCMRSIINGLDNVFQITDRAIILEDDCKPSIDFFLFMEWGLEKFEKDKNIGMISGSNLIADKHKIILRNGFSIFISIWGWATWKDRWEAHNSFLSIREINKECNSLLKQIKFNYWQRLYWKELFKFTVYSGDTWDFQLQYSFFKNNLLSVYPKINLIENIGFSGEGTHTNFDCPSYVSNNIPDIETRIMSFEESTDIKNSLERDILLAKEIWKFNPYSALKLKLKNFLILLNIIK
jgi:hypothetical protein